MTRIKGGVKHCLSDIPLKEERHDARKKLRKSITREPVTYFKARERGSGGLVHGGDSEKSSKLSY